MPEAPKIDLLISVVVLIRDEAEALPPFVAETHDLLSRRYSNFEILLIDNGSKDDSRQVVTGLLERHKCLRFLSLSRAVNGDIALTAGLDAAIGDYVVTANSNFDPPNEIPAMVELCRSGYDVVFGVDRARIAPPSNFIYRWMRSAFLLLSRWLLRLEIPAGTTGFRVFSRSAVNALTRIRSRRRFFSILASDIGLVACSHLYTPVYRTGGTQPRRLFESTRTGMSVLLHYSILPLRLVSLIAFIGSGLSLIYSLYVVVVYLLKPDVASGWTTLSLQVSGLFAIVFLMLALLGECMGRVMEEVLQRPLYHIRDEQSSAVMLSDAAKRNVLGQSSTSE
jgi:glycosyltransferase involved in cell wall biosynthesis